MQLHIGGNNDADSCFDSMNDPEIARPLSGLLDYFEAKGNLPKIILYPQNPKDNYVIASIAGKFQSKIPGKIQFGLGWRFNDHKDAISEQLKAIANAGVISKFIGMTTDSYSPMGYVRHEYFRRIVCNLLGSWVDGGEYPDDIDMLGKIAMDICYRNAKKYFNF